MAIDADRLLNWPFEDVVHAYTERDTMLYALGVGLARDPTDERELRFVYEADLLALPTLSVILGYPGFWLKDPATGVDWVKVLHGEQTLEIHQPLPVAATVIGRTRVTEVLDKGVGKGALIMTERAVTDEQTGALLCTLRQTTFARGDGGFGGDAGTSRKPRPLPTRAPDLSRDLATDARAALLYRLSGDANPLHADPAVARAAGFERPILHGLATLGVAGHAILAELCDHDPSRLESMALRFSAPVYPGETLRTEMWLEGPDVLFRTRVLERDTVVLTNGLARIA